MSQELHKLLVCKYQHGRECCCFFNTTNIIGWKQVGESVNLQSPVQKAFTTPYGNTVNHFMNNYKKQGGVDFDSLSDLFFEIMADYIVSHGFSE